MSDNIITITASIQSEPTDTKQKPFLHAIVNPTKDWVDWWVGVNGNDERNLLAIFDTTSREVMDEMQDYSYLKDSKYKNVITPYWVGSNKGDFANSLQGLQDLIDSGWDSNPMEVVV